MIDAEHDGSRWSAVREDSPVPRHASTPWLPRWMRREQWTLGLVGQSAESIVRHGLSGPVRWMAPPRDGFIADPWGMALPDGRLRLFAEVLDYSSFKGVLAAAIVDRAQFEQVGPVPFLDLIPHLSYPQPVAWRGGWLLFCESWEAHAALVFSADTLDGPWRPEARLLPGVPVIDPTPVEHEGHWYLFHTRRDDGPNSRLHLLHADGPLGPWWPHGLGVVAEGAGGARPAGPLFRLSDGTLIRPGQDSRHTYGGALRLYRVDALTPNHYAETLVRTVTAPAGAWEWGLHTLCPLDEVSCLIDGKRWVAAPLEPLWGLTRLLATKQRRRYAKCHVAKGW